MPDLPRVLCTDVIRSAHQGESHGGVHLVDLSAGTSERVIDWDTADIDWSGRGGDRGLRGIAFDDDRVFIAASDEIFIFDKSFNRLGSFTCPYLKHCHEITTDGRTLWATSTGYNALLAYDLDAERFTKAYHLAPTMIPAPDKRGRTREIEGIVSRPFDPNASSGPPLGDVVHVNHVWRENNKTYASGVRMDHLWQIPDAGGPCIPVAPVPLWTHNCRPYHAGVLYNSTASESIVFADATGRERFKVPIPCPDAGELTHTNLPQDHARAGFGRGLTVTNKGVVIGGSSPSTVTAYDLQGAKTLASVRLTDDIRNAIHGLELWPFD